MHTNNDSHTVYAEVSGCARLGNWMFIYAAAISKSPSVVLCNILEPIDDPKREGLYNEIFKVPPVVRSIPSGVVQYREPSFTYNPLPDVPLQGLHIFGDFQSEKYFDIPKVRETYAISPAREQRLREKMGDWLNRPNVTSIHVRRGDYMRWPQFYPFVGKQYLRSCIKRIPECHDFVVCSDDVRWCKRFFSKAFPDLHFFFSENTNPIDDLFLMSLCKNNIMSNSTFSWWGAWLNANPAKRVFAPSMWFGFGRNLNWKDIYFAGTEVVPNQYSFALKMSAYWYTARENLGQLVWKILRAVGLRTR